MSSVSYTPADECREMRALASKLCGAKGCLADSLPDQPLCGPCREKYLARCTERFPRRNPGWVYFIEDTATGHIKIGFSRDPEKRFQHLRCGTDSELVLLAGIPGSFKKERSLHQYFAVGRVTGEWYQKSDDLYELIAMAAEKERQRISRQLLVASRDLGIR